MSTMVTYHFKCLLREIENFHKHSIIKVATIRAKSLPPFGGHIVTKSLGEVMWLFPVSLVMVVLGFYSDP